jgi:hypothetical protein
MNNRDNLDNILYDIYGNIDKKDYNKLVKLFDDAKGNVDIYQILKPFTRCYCGRIIRSQHLRTHILSKQHRLDAREELPPDIIYRFSSVNPYNKKNKNPKSVIIDKAKYIIKFD